MQKVTMTTDELKTVKKIVKSWQYSEEKYRNKLRKKELKKLKTNPHDLF